MVLVVYSTMTGMSAVVFRIANGTKPHLFALNATNGALSRNAIHCPESRNRRVRNACAPFSGITNWVKA